MHVRYWLVYTSIWIFIGSELWLGSLHCLSDLIPQNPIKFHYHLCFIHAVVKDGANKKIRRCSNCGVVYSGPVCLHRSAVRNNNKMEAKQSREGRGGKRAGLVTEGMMYWSRLTGCCGPINPDGREEPVRRFSWVVRVTQTTGNEREINSSRKKGLMERWMDAWIIKRK